MMTTAALLKHLARLNACSEATEWVASQKGSAAQIWSKCPRADWLLWLAVSAGVSKDAYLPAVYAVAERAVSVTAPKALRSAADVLEKAGKPQDAQILRAHAAVLSGVRITDPARAADAARVARAAAAAAARTVRDAAYAAWAADEGARAAEHKVLGGIIRKRIKWATVAKALEAA